MRASPALRPGGARQSLRYCLHCPSSAQAGNSQLYEKTVVGHRSSVWNVVLRLGAILWGVFRSLLTSFVLSVGIAAQAQGPPARGNICGTVLDETARPAAFTDVAAIYLGPHSGPFPTAKTDQSGHYCVTGVRFGEYAMSAYDEAKGYPLLITQFFTTEPPEARVTLTADVPDGRADWRIPYKAGFLRISLTDADTGKVIPSMFVNLVLRVDGENRYMHPSAPSDLALLIPPNEDVYVNVTSPGYDIWPNDGSRGMLLSFLPGQTHTLKIALQKAK